MRINIKHLLSISFSLLVIHTGHVIAVTDAELEALEQQIEQQEVDKKRKAEAEARRKAEAKRKAEEEAKRKPEEERKRKAEEEKRLLELEKQRQEEEQKRLTEEKIIEEEKRKAEKARLAELEQKLQEEEARQRAEEEKRLLELEKERNRVPQAILGEWQSGQGGWRAGFTMVFSETDDGQIDGIYYPFLSSGEIIGSLEGNTLSGLWFQSGALQSCPETRNGTTHWGHFSFQFINNFTEFIGKWGYCEEEPTKNWKGKKIK